jgi:DNA primase
MPKIPQDELDRIKSEIDLAALVRAKGVELKPHGTADLIGRCPLHNDKTPSLVITPSKGLWHCLGACQVGGSVVDWVMKTEGVSFRHAVTLLQEGKAASLLSGDKIVSQSTTRKLASPLTLDADDQALLNQVTTYYHETLKQSPKALEYLRHRGLGSAEALNTFKLGYADRTLGLRLPEKNREAGAAIRERLQKLGVYRQSGHEHLSGSLIIPILDGHGNTVNLYGRKILDNLRAGTAYHLYLPGPHRGLFNPAALTQPDLILCESLIDALSFWVHGFRNVTTAYGVEGFTEEMLSALLSQGVRRVFIAYDRDEAGDRAAAKLGEKLIGEGLEAFRVQFPHGMDANEYIRKEKPEAKALQALLHGAEWMGKGQRPTARPKTEALPTGERVDVETGEVLEALTLPLAAESTAEVAPASPAIETMATPSPSPASAIPCEVKGEDVHITLGDRSYRIRGLYKNTSFEVLKVNLRASFGSRYYIDSLDLYNAKARETFVSHAAVELEIKAEIVKRDLGRVLLKLEDMQEAHIHAAQKPKEEIPSLSESEREAALAYLSAPDLWARLCEDLRVCGYVGEEVNKQVGYLAALSRRLPDPLSLLIQSSSAAGKSSLMDTVLSFVPAEERVSFSAMTGQALFYMDKDALRHKCLSIAEEGGMERAAYSLKLLITEKRLSIASTGKDEQSGKHVTQTYEVEGPAAILYTTTNAEVDPELKNRCITLSVNEERAQTRAIHEAQRRARTLEGRRDAVERRRRIELHHNVQRLLRPVAVLNPFAGRLTFLDVSHALRRDQMKYLNLIDTIAYLHQYQRPRKRDSLLGEYIEVTPADIATANALANEVLGRSLDELAPQTRRLLSLLKAMVLEIAKDKALEWPLIRFSRFDIRKATRWGDTQLKVHLRRLVEMEYLLIHRSGRGLTFEYELVYRGEGEEGDRFMLGLIDADELQNGPGKQAYDFERSGVNGHRAGSGRPLVGGQAGGGRGEETALSPNVHRGKSNLASDKSENAYQEGKAPASYHSLRNGSFSLAASLPTP